MSLKKRELSASLVGGYTSEGLQKDGERGTFEATFTGLSSSVNAHLEQSVDGENYQKIPESDAIIETGQAIQIWNDDITPRGTMLRIVVESAASGTINGIKLLSNG